ncbi:MAG: hypothetical protein QOH69_1285 [Actinomycetota bacterium]|nr:hypothetical protein [Actinomycetota bacterium]
MRFVLAIICFIIAFGTLGTGIAERTFLAPPSEVTLHTVSHSAAPVLVIDGAALNSYKQTQNVKLSGSATAFAAYGRTSDVRAWVGNATYNEVTLNRSTGQLQSKLHTGKTSAVPNPAGSDLWLQQFPFDQAKNFSIKIPTDMSVIAVSNGKLPAPSDVSLTWPLDNSRPWTGPLILAGAIALLAGLILLLIAFYHLRSTRGPRRSQPRMPKLPRQPRLRPQRKAITASKGRRSIRNFVALVPTLGVSVLLLAGCTVAPAPTIATPSATPSALAAATKTPAVTTVQLQQIMQSVAATVKNADSKFDDKVIKTRMAGPALADRLANYTIRKANPQLASSIAIPSGEITVNLPQASNTWPRTVFTVLVSKAVATKTTKASTTYTALMLIQDDPRANYKVNYAMTLEPNIKFAVAPSKVGTARLNPDTGLFKMQPAAIAVAYGDILDKDKDASAYNLFEPKGDTFRTQVGAESKKAQIAALPATASLTYTNSNGSGQVVVLATTDSGAIVAVDLNETETVKPVQAGAAVSAPGQIQALSGKATSTTGLVAVYGDQLLFYVPAASKSSKIVLLGYGQGLISAKEL